jgi:hypothetical protein
MDSCHGRPAGAAAPGLLTVYNTRVYDNLGSLRLMEGIVDIYLPNLKMWAAGSARRHPRMPGCPRAARTAVRAMNRQAGPLRFGEDGQHRDTPGLAVARQRGPSPNDHGRPPLMPAAHHLT